MGEMLNYWRGNEFTKKATKEERLPNELVFMKQIYCLTDMETNYEEYNPKKIENSIFTGDLNEARISEGVRKEVNLHFNECTFKEVVIDKKIKYTHLVFENCTFIKKFKISEAGLTRLIFRGCKFSNAINFQVSGRFGSVLLKDCLSNCYLVFNIDTCNEVIRIDNCSKVLIRAYGKSLIKTTQSDNINGSDALYPLGKSIKPAEIKRIEIDDSQAVTLLNCKIQELSNIAGYTNNMLSLTMKNTELLMDEFKIEQPLASLKINNSQLKKVIYSPESSIKYDNLKAQEETVKENKAQKDKAQKDKAQKDKAKEDKKKKGKEKEDKNKEGNEKEEKEKVYRSIENIEIVDSEIDFNCSPRNTKSYKDQTIAYKAKNFNLSLGQKSTKIDVSGLEVEHFTLSGKGNLEAKFTSLHVKDFSFEGYGLTSGECSFKGITFSEKASFHALESKFDSTRFYDIDFSAFTSINYQFSFILDAIFYNCAFPFVEKKFLSKVRHKFRVVGEDAKTLKKGNYDAALNFYRHLKINFQKVGDGANLAMAKQSEKRLEYVLSGWREKFWTKVKLGLNDFTNAHGTSYERPRILLLLWAAVGYSLFVPYLDTSISEALDLSSLGRVSYWKAWLGNAGWIPALINPIYTSQWIAKVPPLLFSLYSLVFAYLLYQFIAAFRSRSN